MQHGPRLDRGAVPGRAGHAGGGGVALFTPQVRLLFWKEVRQLTRNQAALLSVLFLPTVLVGLAPVLALLASRAQPVLAVPRQASLPGFHDVQGTVGFALLVTFPILFVLATTLTPILTATSTIVSERERHTLDLLLALPVRLGDILLAKLGAVLAAGATMIVPMFLIDAVVMMALADVDLSYIGGALLLILCTLFAAGAASLLMALMAQDARSASYCVASLPVPPLFLTALCVVFVPGLWRFLAMAALMVALAIAALVAGLRVLTLERYLS
ncbi:MAG TPA: ABC transporter permease subunit [Candidatus Dormibacteraeota bacterium]|nr:ABC transporter permease subunit [Candidatus Dormibacteraeota bacterium]